MTTALPTPPLVAEIDVGAFAGNIRAIRTRLAAGCQIMAVVKADAYGHGAGPLAAVAVKHGVAWFGVARCQEGVALRQYGIDAPILILGPMWPGEVETLIEYRLTPTIGACGDAAHLQRAACRRGLVYPIHVKIDTGMGRFGVTPECVPALLEQLRTCSHLHLEGLMTHLACADTPDVASVQCQLARFQAVLQKFASQGLRPRYIHAANSAGLYRYPESHWTLVRSGIALYGAHPFPAPEAEALRPVLTWKTHLARVQAVPAGCGISYGYTFVTSRPSVIGTLPVGYADGLSRHLSNVGQVLIHGHRVPLVGQICMDMCMVDLTDLACAHVGDEVVLLGAQGDDRITAEEIAAQCGCIPYEVFCAISQRVPRRYVGTENHVCH